MSERGEHGLTTGADPASLLMQQQKRVLDEIRPACVALNDAARIFYDAGDAAQNANSAPTQNSNSNPAQDPDSGSNSEHANLSPHSQSPDPPTEAKAAPPTLSQAATNLIGPLERVYSKLLHLTADKSYVIDSNLGDYIFFPVDSVMARPRALPHRAVELISKIVLVLLRTAWRLVIDGPLGLRLLGRLSRLVDNRGEQDGGGGRSQPIGGIAVSDEVYLSILLSFERIFTGFRATVRRDDRFDIFESDNLPPLAEAVYVILTGIEKGESKEVQLEALNSLAVFCRLVPKGEVLVKNFLPGIVSTLTKVLSPRRGGGDEKRNGGTNTGAASTTTARTVTTTSSSLGKQKRHYTVIVSALNVLTDLLRFILDDGSARNFWRPDRKDPIEEQEWLQPALPHVQRALKNVAMLRDHDKAEVRLGLGRLCVRLLENCRLVLKESVDLLVETYVADMSAYYDCGGKTGPDGDEFGFGGAGEKDGNLDVFEIVEPMKQLMAVDADLQDRLKRMLYEWVQSIPTIVQHPDPAVRARALGHIRFAFGLISGAYCDTSMIGTALRDNVVDAIDLELRKQKAVEHGRVGPLVAYPVESLALTAPKSASAKVPDNERDGFGFLEAKPAEVEFKPVFVRDRAESDVLVQLSAFLQDREMVGVLLPQTGPLLTTLQQSSVETQTAALYVLLKAVRPQFLAHAELGPFGVLDDLSDSYAILDDIYAFSVGVLMDYEGDPFSRGGSADPACRDDSSWRLHALALETVALQALQHQSEFRLELMDVLYPVLTTVGSVREPVREHGLTCLAQMAVSCGYADVPDLLVSNADYLVNSIGTKLGLFETDSKAPVVLLVLVKLCGPAILPFVGDLVDSMFANLENSHQVPGVVEGLFAVLDVIADEAVKVPALAVGEDKRRGKLVGGAGEVRWDECVRVVKKAEAGVADVKDETGPDGDDIRSGDEGDDSAATAVTKPAEPTPFETAEVAKPAGPFTRKRPYGLVLRIATLTQHYLSYPASASFRRSLLGLVCRVLPTLSVHDDSFFPLVNTVWPSVVARLRNESDGYVLAGTMDVVASMCVCAGEFVTQRVVAEAWALIWKLAVAVGPVSLGRVRLSHGEGEREGDESRRVAEALARMVTTGGRGDVGATRSLLLSASADGRSGDARDRDPRAFRYTPMDVRVQQEAVTRLVLAIVSYLHVDDLRFLEIAEWFGPVLKQERGVGLVTSVLARRNGDTVWYVLRKMGERTTVGRGEGSGNMPSVPPGLEGCVFAEA